MYDQVVQNKRRSVALVLAFVFLTALVLAALAYVLGLGSWGMGIAVLLAIGAAVAAYVKSDAVALAVSKAVPADPIQFARLHNLIEGLCMASGLQKPGVYVVEDAAANSFATGRSPAHGAIVVTTGLLERLNRVELEAVLAHELSHIKNYDTLLSTLAVIMVGGVTLVGDLLSRFHPQSAYRRRGDERTAGPGVALAAVGMVLTPVGEIVARVMHLVMRPRRESLADLSAVEMTRYPPGLVSALDKLRGGSVVVATGSRATAHMWLEHPLAEDFEAGYQSRLNRLFNTHPSLEERIAALREL